MNVKPAAGPWPFAIILLILFFLTLTGWSIRQATKGVSAVTNHRYYSHGLKYNQTVVEKEAAAALGWRLESSLEENRLTFRLHDGEGKSVAGARGELTLYGAESDRGRSLALRETGDGMYVTDLPAGLGSQISARIQLSRGGASLSRALLLNL